MLIQIKTLCTKRRLPRLNESRVGEPAASEWSEVVREAGGKLAHIWRVIVSATTLMTCRWEGG